MENSTVNTKSWWIIIGGRRRLGRALAEALSADFNLILTSSASWEHETGWIEEFSKQTNIRCLSWNAKDEDIAITIMNNMESLKAEGIVPKCMILASGTFQENLLGRWSPKDLATTWQINLTFPLLVIQTVSNYFVDNSCIQILLDTSIYKPFLKRIPHSIAEAGLQTMVSGLAHLLAPKTRVVGHALGVVMRNPETDPGNLIDKNLLKKIGSPKDLELALRFVANSPYLTGTIITLDGGMHIK